MDYRFLLLASSTTFRFKRLLYFILISLVLTYCPLSEGSDDLSSTVTSESGYTLIDLGTLGGKSSHGHGINNKGWVTGSWWNTQKKRSQAFIFDSGGMRDIGSLGGITTKGHAINESGLVVGHGKTTDGNWAAFLYDGNVLKRLEARGVKNSWATAINNNNDIIGYLDLGTRNYASFLLRNGRLIDLGTLGGNTWAEDISDSGFITGNSLAEEGVEAFLWRDGVMKSLGKMGGQRTKAAGVTEEGIISGSVYHADGRGPFFIADSSSRMLVQVPGGRGAEPYAINNSGYVVGEIGHPDVEGDVSVAFLYDGEQVHILCDLLDCEKKGWSRVFAHDINDYGDMTGTARISGQSQAFLVLNNSAHSKGEIDRIIALANRTHQQGTPEQRTEVVQSTSRLSAKDDARGLLTIENNAESITDFKKSADKFKCTPLGEIENKPMYLSRITSWSVTSEYDQNTATMFWCKNPGAQRDFKIVIVVHDDKHPWKKCPPTIETSGGFSPLNLSLNGLAVSGEYDQGGYLFKCNDGNWDIQFSD